MSTASVIFLFADQREISLCTKCRCFSLLIGWKFYDSFVHKEVGDVANPKHVKAGLCFYFHFLKSTVVHAVALSFDGDENAEGASGNPATE